MAAKPSLAAIDLGTSKVLAAVAEIGPAGEIQVTGVGLAPARGLLRGVVIDLADAAASVALASERAARMAGRPLPDPILGLCGGAVSSCNRRGGVDLEGEDGVGPQDAARALAEARRVTPAAGRDLVHAIPRCFVLDEYENVRDPVGLAGLRLDVEMHLVTAPSAVLRNAARCLQRAGLGVADITLNGLAAAEAVSTAEERELGVVVADIGAGCTDVVVFRAGAPAHTAVVPIGGDLIRNDIAAGLHLTLAEAESIKLTHGLCTPRLADPEVAIEVAAAASPAGQPAAVGPARSVSEIDLAEIVEARAEELLAGIGDAVAESGCARELPAGLVLTGGGANLRGLPPLAMRQLQLPVRTATPRGCAGVEDLLGTPACAAAVGLLQLAASGLAPAERAPEPARRTRRRGLFGWRSRRG